MRNKMKYNWYKLRDPSCQFLMKDGKVFGKINDAVYILQNNEFKLEKYLERNGKKSSVKKNSPYFPDDLKDSFKTHAKMIPHHFRYVKGAIGKMSDLAD